MEEKETDLGGNTPSSEVNKTEEKVKVSLTLNLRFKIF